MGGNDLLHNVQPEPRPAGFGGVQRVENLRELLGGYPAACITHVALHGGLRALANQRQGPALGHSVEGVLHQIMECTLQRKGMERHLPHLLQDVKLECHTARDGQVLPLVRPRLHQISKVLWRALNRRDARQREIILHQLLQTRELEFDLREGFADHRGLLCRGRLPLSLQDLDLQNNRREGIAEVMGHARRQASQQCKVLRLL
jgi:hypothetical protein